MTTPSPSPQADPTSLTELLARYEQKRPEIVFEWKDAETEAEGWVVINSLRGGAAGGGTRMRAGLDRHEVESLAKTMEVKFTVSGPPIGGAKSGINFDPRDPRRRGVLERWFKAVFPLLKNYYGTGGDLNVDEIHDVIAITEGYGLWHPQEGVVTGHLQASKPEKIRKLGQLRQGVIKVVEDELFTPDRARRYTVADLITGYGVAEAVYHYYELWGGSVRGKRAIVQGWGNVGAAAAYYLAKAGAHVVGIIDRVGGLLSDSPTGFTFEEIRALLLQREGNALVAPNLLPFEEVNARVWSHGAEIFVPAAASRLVTQPQLEELLANGLEVISCGANVPFNDSEIFFGPTADFADQRAAVIPDFIANCGMARVFAYLMKTDAVITDQAIFQDTSRVIREALQRTRAVSDSPREIARRSFELALRQLV